MCGKVFIGSLGKEPWPIKSLEEWCNAKGFSLREPRVGGPPFRDGKLDLDHLVRSYFGFVRKFHQVNPKPSLVASADFTFSTIGKTHKKVFGIKGG